MPTKKTIKKEVKPKVVAASKEKPPKFKLISYTLKATIPTGQYANIQPEITVEAKTIEQAERAVMPYIETLFARYRDGGVKPIEPTVARTVTPVTPPPAPAKAPVAPVAAAVVPKPSVAPVAPVASPIVLTVPFNRAKGAIDSCMSNEALKLVADQVEKSTKLIDTEKVELRKLVAAKSAQLNGPKTI